MVTNRSATCSGFDLHAPCEKCGNKLRRAEYHAGHDDLGIFSYWGICMTEAGPHMLRSCRVCGHQSVEAPLDSTKGTK